MTMKYRILLCSLFCLCAVTVLRAERVDMLNAGAKVDGKTLNTKLINSTIMLSGHGGVVIGSEMSGGVRKVTISNCIFDGTDRGIRLKSTRGRGGVVEDIRVSNIVMRNIKQEAVVLNISGMTVTDVKTPVKIVGLEEAPISDIVLRDIHVQGAGEECVFEDCERITMEDVMVNGKKMYPKEVDEK